MKVILQRHAILLAALLQVFPIIKNIFVSPAASSGFAFILRWGLGATAALETVDAVSGATTYFTSASTFTGTVGVPFTNNITLNNTKSDAGSLAVITSNSVSAVLSKVGQSTNFAMPSGLLLQFQENVNLTSPVYDAIYGVPTTPGTNTFIISMEYASIIVSTNITITISPASSVMPSITNQPVSITNLVGSKASFNVTAGPEPLNYQWFFNTNTALPNETSPVLTLTNVQLAQAGFYSIIASNFSGSVTSAPAKLTVWQSPSIISQTASATNMAGGTTHLRVIASGSPLPNYQWFFNTNTPLVGATNSSLNFTNVRSSQAGYYSALITNEVGGVTSTPIRLLITPPAPPTIGAISVGRAAGEFQFSFNGVAGLTNTVQTSGNLTEGQWATLTNIPPPATTNIIVITDTVSASNQFYRVQIVP